jgi:hypothetical protein
MGGFICSCIIICGVIYGMYKFYKYCTKEDLKNYIPLAKLYLLESKNETFNFLYQKRFGNEFGSVALEVEEDDDK